MSLPVCELFLSLQGESSYAGKPCFFIRLTGCNLRCHYCDTPYALSFDAAHEDLSVETLVESAVGSGAKIVEITGGEPLVHPETPRLAQALLDAGMTVLVETNGSLDIGLLPRGVIRIMDVKGPGSGMADQIYLPNLEKITTIDEIKFVVGERADFEYAVQRVREYHLDEKTSELQISPISGTVTPALLARWILESKLPFTLHLQLHKIIWPQTDRGV